jgi:hypothetical protein
MNPKGSIISVYFLCVKVMQGVNWFLGLPLQHKVLFQLWSVFKCLFLLLDFRELMYHVGGIQY